LNLAFAMGWLGAKNDVQTRTYQEITYSLKGLGDDPKGLERSGPDADKCVLFEPEGLRITLPTDYAGPPGFHGERPDTGVIVPVAIKGDFDISVSYEILGEPEKNDAGYPQTRVTLDVGVARGSQTISMLSRKVTKWGGRSFAAWVRRGEGEKGKNHDFP